MGVLHIFLGQINPLSVADRAGERGRERLLPRVLLSAFDRLGFWWFRR